MSDMEEFVDALKALGSAIALGFIAVTGIVVICRWGIYVWEYIK